MRGGVEGPGAMRTRASSANGRAARRGQGTRAAAAGDVPAARALGSSSHAFSSAGPYQSRRQGRVGRSTRGGAQARRGRAGGLGRAASRSVPFRPRAEAPPPSGGAGRGRSARRGRGARPRPSPPLRLPRPRVPAPPPRAGTSAAERMLIPVLFLLRRRWRRPPDPRKPACWRNSSWKKKVSAPRRDAPPLLRPGAGPPAPHAPEAAHPRRAPGRSARRPAMEARGWRGASAVARGASAGDAEPGSRMVAPFVLSSQTRQRARCHAVVIACNAAGATPKFCSWSIPVKNANCPPMCVCENAAARVCRLVVNRES